MGNKIRIYLAILCFMLFAASCMTRVRPGTPPDADSRGIPESRAESIPEQPPEPEEPYTPPKVFEGPSPKEYVSMVVDETLEKFLEPDMTEYEKTKAAFDYIIENSFYEWPLALDIWRIRCGEGEELSYIENRALSVLLNGLGTCEDYSAALVMLLEAMDIDAIYMPGLTYHAEGHLVHHAWVMAKVDGTWYHLDSQLEDGISNGIIRYKYFMKSDSAMLASHRWGQNLIAAGILEEDQNREIQRKYMGEACPADYKTPAPKEINKGEANLEKVWYKLQAEYFLYISEYGEPEYTQLEVNPPVFGRYGGYDGKDGVMDDRPRDYIYRVLVNRMLIQKA